jgi:predicted transcriptional regulator
MKVAELIEKLNLTVFESGENMNRELTGGYASDLLSDVMGKTKPDMVWITLQSHVNIIAVASLKDLAAIIIVHGQVPPSEVIEKACAEGITLLGTESDTFLTAAKVYQCLFSDGTGTR